MMKSILSIAYAVSLLGNVAPQAAETHPLQVVAEEQARQSLAAARKVIRVELAQAMRMSAEPAERNAVRTARSGAAEPGQLPLEPVTAGK